MIFLCREKTTGVYVLVKKGESDKKTINRASADWRSTFAVKYIKHVISFAHGMEEAPIYLSQRLERKKRTVTKTWPFYSMNLHITKFII